MSAVSNIKFESFSEAEAFLFYSVIFFFFLNFPSFHKKINQWLEKKSQQRLNTGVICVV